MRCQANKKLGNLLVFLKNKMWPVPLTCVWKCKSGLIVLGFVVAIISLSSSTSSRVTGLQWEEHKSRVAIDNESVIIEGKF